MKILHTSDWHLGKTLENINRIEEQRDFVNYICTLVDEENIDLIIIAGDIYDTYNPSSAAEELFYEALDRLGSKPGRAVVVIAGNHDSPERLCASSALASKHGITLLGYPSSSAGENGLKNEGVKLADSGEGWLELSIDGYDYNAVVLTLPYPSEARLEELLTSSSDEESIQLAYSEKVGLIFRELGQKFRNDTVNLAVSHIYVQGGKTSDSERTIQVGGAMTVTPEVLPQNAHYVALGHLHRPQKVTGSPSPAYYSGSPLAYSFSEADYSKAVYVIDAEPNEEAKITPVYLTCGKPLKRWTAKNGYSEVLKWCEEGRDQGAWIDIEVLTDRVITVEEIKALRDLNKGIVNIRPILRAEAVEELQWENRENKKIDELFKEFYKHRIGIDVTHELMNIFLDVLNSDEDEEDREDSEALTGGDDIETKIS